MCNKCVTTINDRQKVWGLFFKEINIFCFSKGALNKSKTGNTIITAHHESLVKH